MELGKSSGTVLAPNQPHVQWVPDFTTDGKWHDVRHSSPSNAHIKNEWIFTSCPIKHLSEHNISDFDL